MAVEIKSYNKFVPVNLADKHNKLEFKCKDILTVQGLNLKNYNILSDTVDSLTKNYTYNNLSQDKNINDVAEYKKQPFIQDLNTKLGFNALNPELSSYYFITVVSNFRDDPNFIGFSNVNTLCALNQNVLVNFIDDMLCEVSFVDGKLNKNLYINIGSPDGNYLTFNFLNKDTKCLNNHIFKYAYDEKNKYLSLFKTINGQETVMRPADVYVESLTATIPTLSAAPITAGNLTAGIINVNDKVKILNDSHLDQYVYYDFQNNNKLSVDSVSSIKYDLLSYMTFEDLYLKNSDGKIYGNVDFFNLKNHVSNENLIQPTSNLENGIQKRRYSSIINKSNTEIENEDIGFNYNFYSKDYTLLADKITKFTLPNDISPYKKVNINDASIGKAGAYAGMSPYFSDKIYKLQDTNNNNVQESFVNDESFVIKQDDVSFVLQQDDNTLIGLQDLDEKQDNDITGAYLCTWLKGDGINGGQWLDRYYIPTEYSYVAAFSGNKDQVFENTSQAKEYFESNGVLDSFYDVSSNMVFEPNSTYLYQRVGKSQVKSVIDTQSKYLVKDTFTIQLSNQYLFDQNELNLNLTNGFDQTPFETFDSKNFNISFELELDDLTSLNTYQLFGNLYGDGFSLKNNFYFTPYVYITNENHLYVYDKEFNLIQKNTYDVQKIIDTLYIEQNNDIVLVCNDRLIQTNIYGEVSNEVIHDTSKVGQNLSNLIRSYKDKTYTGYNNVSILTHDNYIQTIDLNNLIPESGDNNQIRADHNSTVKGLTGVKSLLGFKGKLLTDDIAVSMDNLERFIVIDRLPGVSTNPISKETFEGTPLSAVYPNGIAARRVFFEDDYNTIVSVGLARDPGIASKFEKAGENRVIYDDLLLENEIEPIIDSIDKRLYDINVLDEKLYVQFVNLQYIYTCNTNGLFRSIFQSTTGEEIDLYNKYINGIPENYIIFKEEYNDIINFNGTLSASFNESLRPADGKVQIFDADRYTLSSFDLNSEVVSGYKIDFINDGDDIQLMSFGKDLSGNIIVDKFDLTDGKLINTYNLGIPAVDTKYQTYYFCIGDIPFSSISNIPSISAQYPKGIKQTYILNEYEYTQIIDSTPSLNSSFDSIGGMALHADPIGMYQVHTKYKHYQNKLHFKFNLNSYLPVGLESVEWQDAGPPAVTAFKWENPAEGFSGWDSFAIPTSEEQTNTEIMIEVPPLQIKNFFNFNFNLENGTISLYHNGLTYGAIKFNPNYYPINKILYPNLFLNSPNIKNKAVSKSTKNNDYFSRGGVIKNYRIYNNVLNNDMINYLQLNTVKIDDLNFEIQCGTRNDIEEINSLYNYKIPGFKNDTTKIIIKNIKLDENTTTNLIEYLDSNIYKALPFNVQNIIYSINGVEYQTKNNKALKVNNNNGY